MLQEFSMLIEALRQSSHILAVSRDELWKIRVDPLSLWMDVSREAGDIKDFVFISLSFKG
jgi:hypothetical protein